MWSGKGRVAVVMQGHLSTCTSYSLNVPVGPQPADRVHVLVRDVQTRAVTREMSPDGRMRGGRINFHVPLSCMERQALFRARERNMFLSFYLQRQQIIPHPQRFLRGIF